MRPRPDVRRYERRAQLEVMDPARHAHEIYRAFALLEFPEDLKLAFHLSYARPLAVPRMAALLAHTGHTAHEPIRRAADTGLFMFELIEHGADHPRGREVIRALNRMHHRWAIKDEDYRYVLATFAVIPVRWIDQWAWRASTPVERQACVTFYADVGAKMNIKDMPATYEGWAALFDDYEARHFTSSVEGRTLMGHIHSLVRLRLPVPLRRLSAPLMGALVDERTRTALGLPKAGVMLRAGLTVALRLRAAVGRRTPPVEASWFTPGTAIPGIYPDGYEIAALGPRSACTQTQEDA